MNDPQAIEAAIRAARAFSALTTAGPEIAAADPHVQAAIEAAHLGDDGRLFAALEAAADHLGSPVRLVLAALSIRRRLT